MRKLTLVSVAVVLAVSALGGVVVSGTTPVPHENPMTAGSRFDFAPPLLHYSDVFGRISERDYENARALLRELKIDFANLPQEIVFIMARYNELSAELTRTLDRLDSILDSCEQLLSQNKLDEVAPVLDEAGGIVEEVAEFMETIGIATDEMLGLLAPFASPEEAGALSVARARLQKAVERLRELEEWYRSRLEALDKEAEEKETLLSTELTLDVSPAQVWVGDPVTLSGALQSEDMPLPGREISIFLGGKEFTTAATREDGSYECRFAVPYWYTPRMAAQSFYLPRGDDRAGFTAALSVLRTIDVLFHSTDVTMDVPDVIYPGLVVEIGGEVVSQGNSVGREVNVLLDGQPLFEAITDDCGSFRQQATLTGETRAGVHSLSVSVAPENESRSAGASSDSTLNVVKVTPEVLIYAPKFVLLPRTVEAGGELPFPFSLRGRVELRGELRSPLPMQGAALTLEMAGVSTTARTDGGNFKLGMDLPLDFSLVGLEELKLGLVPAESWHLSAERRATVFVVNLVYLGIVVMALVLAVVMLAIRVSHIAKRTARSPLYREAPQSLAAVPESSLPAIRAEPVDSKGLILQAYYEAAAGVQRLAGRLLTPQVTLREFLAQVGPALGWLAEAFTRLTGLAERALYSHHRLGKGDASLAGALASELRKAWLMLSRRF
jgi:hypothetical protein